MSKLKLFGRQCFESHSSHKRNGLCFVKLVLIIQPATKDKLCQLLFWYKGPSWKQIVIKNDRPTKWFDDARSHIAHFIFYLVETLKNVLQLFYFIPVT